MACRLRMYILDCTVIAWADTSVELAAEREVAVVDSLGTEAGQSWTEAHRIVPGSCAIAGKPGTAADDGPWSSTVPTVPNM